MIYEDNMRKSNLLSGIISNTAHSENADNIILIAVDQIDHFENHPFRIYDKDKLDKLAQSIKDVGLLHPVAVRQKDNGRYEMLSGHNRLEASILAGKTHILGKVINADDDTAILIVTEGNLKQRETLLPSERARAYKMQLEPLKSQGKRNDLIKEIEEWCSCGSQVEDAEAPMWCSYGSQDANILWSQGTKVKSRDIVAAINNTSSIQISRYIRLLNLIPELLDKVDSERLAFRVGVNLSYINQASQEKISRILDDNESLAINLDMSTLLRKAIYDDIESIMGVNTSYNKVNRTVSEKPAIKIAFKAVEKKYKTIDPEIAEKIDAKELESKVMLAVEEYMLSLNE